MADDDFAFLISKIEAALAEGADVLVLDLSSGNDRGVWEVPADFARDVLLPKLRELALESEGIV